VPLRYINWWLIDWLTDNAKPGHAFPTTTVRRHVSSRLPSSRTSRPRYPRKVPTRPNTNSTKQRSQKLPGSFYFTVSPAGSLCVFHSLPVLSVPCARLQRVLLVFCRVRFFRSTASVLNHLIDLDQELTAIDRCADIKRGPVRPNGDGDLGPKWVTAAPGRTGTATAAGSDREQGEIRTHRTSQLLGTNYTKTPRKN